MLSLIEKYTKTPWVYLLALLLGLLQAVVFDFSFDSQSKWLAPLFSVVSLAGFLSILAFLTPKRAMLFGYVFGIGLFGWGLNWVYISMAQFGGAPLFFAVAANALAVVYLALYWLLGAYLIAKLGKTRNQRLLLAPAVIALLEWVRSVFLIGFPWLSLGYGWVDTSFGQLASLGGVFFVSFALVLCISLLLLDVPKHFRAVAVLLACFVGVALLYALNKAPAPQGKTTTVALIQGNMPVITEYNRERMAQNLVKYKALTDKILATEKPDIIIWPEAAVPHFYVEVTDFLDEMYALQQENKFDLIAGVPHGNWKTNEVYNSVLLQKNNDYAPQFYNKSHLLPFGEYLPFRSVFAFFKDFVQIPMSDFARGEPVQPPFVAGGLRFAPSICFEAVSGDGIRKNARGAQVLLNVSNDAWFGKSKAQLQHLNIARMRAIENQKMLVRATNDGRTAIVGTDGAVLKTIPPFADGVLTSTVNASDKATLYSKFGDMPWVILFALWGVLVIATGRIIRERT